MREDPRLKDVLLVALTGYGQGEDRQRTRAAGFDHHFTKPVEPDALNRLVTGLPPRGAIAFSVTDVRSP